MTTIVCDRCKATLMDADKTPLGMNSRYTIEMIPLRGARPVRGGHLDLCEKCAQAFCDWLDSRP